MADELVVSVNEPFSTQSWTEVPPQEQAAVQVDEKPAATEQPAAAPETPADGKPAAAAEPAAPSEPAETVLDSKDYIKSFGYDSEDLLKQDLSELGTLREFRKQFTEFSNEESKRIYELLKEGKKTDVLDFLSTQTKIETLLDSDVNIKTAEDILKLNMQKQNPDLAPEDVEFMFDRKYAIPAKPVEKDIETPEEYEGRLKEWERQVEVVQREMVIAAKQAKTDLAKYKTELRLPDIERKSEQQAGPSKEELEQQQKASDYLKQKISSDYKNFTGFTVPLKNEDVEAAISFTVDETEREKFKSELVEGTFTPENFLMDRWIGEDGEPNVKLIFEDVMLLKNRDSVFQKMVNEASSQTIEQILKRKSNVQLGASQQETYGGGKGQTNLDEQIKHIWETA